MVEETDTQGSHSQILPVLPPRQQKEGNEPGFGRAMGQWRPLRGIFRVTQLGLQSQTSNMGFSTPYPMVLLLFTIVPVGHRKEIGK